MPINNNTDGTNIFMIHPGSGGCEVYVPLAETLEDKFSCYGVDYYNLTAKNKIDDLRQLAEFYLSHIDKVMQKTKQKQYCLFGWSLGGKIALEIALVLEQRGNKSVKVLLLDTILFDDSSRIISEKIEASRPKKLYLKIEKS